MLCGGGGEGRGPPRPLSWGAMEDLPKLVGEVKRALGRGTEQSLARIGNGLLSGPIAGALSLC